MPKYLIVMELGVRANVLQVWGQAHAKTASHQLQVGRVQQRSGCQSTAPRLLLSPLLLLCCRQELHHLVQSIKPRLEQTQPDSLSKGAAGTWHTLPH